MNNRRRAVMSWSGGKDSAMALYQIRKQNDLEVIALLTTISQEYGRVSHHGVREQLLDEQAAAVGIPLHKVFLPSNSSHPCTNSIYEDIMAQAMHRYQGGVIDCVVFGDIYLEDLRAYRETNLAKVGLTGVFPLWKRDTRQLIRQWCDVGFKAYVCCAEAILDDSFVGVPLDHDFVARLPNSVDPCGENGEYHSFVYDGPIFRHPVSVTVGVTVTRDGRFYADLIPSN